MTNNKYINNYNFTAMKPIDCNRVPYERPFMDEDLVCSPELLCASTEASTEEFNELGNFEW